MVALKAQANTVNVTKEIQADSEKYSRFEVCHSSLSLWKQYIWAASMESNNLLLHVSEVLLRTSKKYKILSIL